MRFVLRVALLTVLAIGLCADVSFAQQGRGGRGGRGGFGGFGGGFGGGGVTGLLRDENVRKELDLVDEQIRKLEDISAKIQDDQRAVFQGFDFQNASDEERQALRAKTQKVQDDAQKEIDQVLLPHQRERLKQLLVQSQMRGGAAQALSGGTLATDLGITEDQKQKLEAKSQEVQAALQEKIQKLRQESEEEVLSVLTPAQQAKLKQMSGAPFTFSQPQFGGFGGRGGDAGGRGGRGRGGRGNNN
jgi:Spy/CpxP family protein refolding chaperone